MFLNSEVPLYCKLQGSRSALRPTHNASAPPRFISQKLFVKLFCKSQFPDKSVNVFFILTNIKNKLIDLCGN